MRRLTLEATDINILESIKNNTLYRNDDVKEFVETLDLIEGNMFISLDGSWGEGKTFFIRQIFSHNFCYCISSNQFEQSCGKCYN